jgi:hypothetical protein
VWQRFFEKHAEAGVELLAVAMDAGGPARARQHARVAGARYPVLGDTEGLLATRYGFRAIPNGWIIDGDGVIRFRQVGGFDIRKPEVAEVIDRVLAGGPPFPRDATAAGPTPAGAAAFQEGVRLLRAGQRREALGAWMRAAEADPENLLIRKQIWHLLYPERFEPEVDFAWQKAQREREASLGIRNANPGPDIVADSQNG